MSSEQSSPFALTVPTYSPSSLEDSLITAGGYELSYLAPDLRSVTPGQGLLSFQDVYLLSAPSVENVPALVARLKTFAGVADAEPCYTFYTQSINDPKFSDQWHLENTGQDTALVDVDIDIAAAWDSTLGSSSITLHILDTGVDDGHDDLTEYSPQSHTCYGMSTDDTAGHGTAVAGLMTALANNIMVRGVCPNCKLGNVRISSNGNISLEQAICGLNFIASNSSARVANNSWGRDQFSFALAAAARDACLSGTYGKLLVAAAGNLNPHSAEGLPAYPAAYNNLTFAVSAVEKGGASWDNGVYGDWIDVSAPGGWEITTTADGNTTRDDFGGTSAAAPVVTGIAGLLLSRNSSLYSDDLSNIIIRTSTDILPVKGWDDHFGWGLVNAHRALKFISNPREVVQGTVTKANVTTTSVSNYYLKNFKNLGWCFNDPNLPDAQTSYLVKRHDMQGTASFSSPFLKSHRNVWPRKKNGLSPGWPDVNPLDCVLQVGWARVDSTAWDSTQVTFKTSTFAVYRTTDTSFVGYFPIHPDSSEIPYTAVLGAFDEAPFVEVHKPNGGESWLGGNREVTWAFTDDGGKDSVSIFWSVNSGDSWRFKIGHGITADSSWTWSVPGQGTSSYHSRIAVVGYDDTGDMNYDMSDADLYVNSPGNGEPPLAFHDRMTGMVFDGEPWTTESGGRVGFSTSVAEHVTVEIFDVSGKRLRILLNSIVDAGRHEVMWDLSNTSGGRVGAGVYFYRVTTPSRSSTGRFVVVR